MLGHALILGRLLEWMAVTDPRMLAASYATFAGSAGRLGLSLFYAICAGQILATFALLSLSLITRCHRASVGIATIAAVVWPFVHYGSGFGSVESVVLRSTSPVSPELAARFQALSTPVHVAHAVTLLVALTVLLSIPLRNGHVQTRLRPPFLAR